MRLCAWRFGVLALASVVSLSVAHLAGAQDSPLRFVPRAPQPSVVVPVPPPVVSPPPSPLDWFTRLAPPRPNDSIYLGRLTNPYVPDSVSNPYGRHGSPYARDSIANPYGRYGSRYSPESATNPYATRAPKVVAPDGTYLGSLSVNPYAPDSISNPYGRYGSPFSPDSVNNPYGRYGSPFSPLSPTNPYASAPPLIFGR